MDRPRHITLEDIARQLGLSKVAVSKALRDHPDISAATKARIRQVAAELGYTPNFIARNLSSRRSQTIGLLVPKIAHSFFADAIEAIYERAFANRYEIVMMVSQENAANETVHLQTLLSMHVDGLLVSVSQETRSTAIFETVRKRGVPLVFFDRVLDGLGFSRVISDDITGAQTATRHLLQQGYDRIAHIGGYSWTSIGRDRFAGYCQALLDAGKTCDERLVIRGGFGEADGAAGLRSLLQHDQPPQAIFAVTYPVALGVLQAAVEHGLRVPQDLDLIAFGGSSYNRFVSPSLTTIDQPAREIGSRAAELLLQEILDPEIPRDRCVVVPTSLVVRDTGKRTL
ncbi:MAG TPA: LacI family DNA-binding transcriptional regulator [bacterium]|nr:LacI family DNA-binding transcriptional regulator [bacterium]HPG46628.1 LacI family DNA-binding transcriptional regulator [bacterium]HPM98839.1 LacI family DNA-binding transcriptional regulator [bacterium]